VEINATKTKVMVVSRPEGVQLEVNHGGQQFEQVQTSSFWDRTRQQQETALRT